ncbi:endosomal targeting BRO1-like domain-containing protein [Striga asiatica]|uniref:Endosomal targeting BRO1-like domain-containing protein n=1 Tax=Striga asiatica TaxID=4170 RepID=A0A5A7Q975_STRAF|nr:endosomal targeting BRO1-like domain-containing protein [Striga asiatica]
MVDDGSPKKFRFSWVDDEDGGDIAWLATLAYFLISNLLVLGGGRDLLGLGGEPADGERRVVPELTRVKRSGSIDMREERGLIENESHSDLAIVEVGVEEAIKASLQDHLKSPQSEFSVGARLRTSNLCKSMVPHQI